MKKKIFVTVYSILVSIIFLGTIIFSGVSLYSKNSKGYTESKRTFDNMTFKLQKAFESPDTGKLASKISEAIGSYEDYSFISIKANGNTIFLFPGDKDQPSENSKFSRLYFKSFKAGDINLYVSANVYTLSPATIAYYAKISFIVVLIFTLLTILLIFIIANDQEEDSEEEVEYDESDNEEAETEEEFEEETASETETTEDISEEDELANAVIDNIENSVLVDEAEVTVEEETEISEVNESEEEPVVEEDPAAEEKSISEETAEEDKKEAVENVELPVDDCMPSEDGPQGLFSPDTGFGWESYLVPRLENELVRASSSEFDVVLFFIKITNKESLEPEKLNKLCEKLVNFFQFKDLIFEYKDNCFACIKTNSNIDEAIPMADQIYSELMEIVEPGKCFIGLTSKTIRLVSADRLMKEALAAMEHAEEEPDCPIIAFRADAEKYMDFIENS